MSNDPYAKNVHFCPSCDKDGPETDFEFIGLVPELGNIARYRCKICEAVFEELPPSFSPHQLNYQRRLDFLSAFGEEFSETLSSTVGEDNITPQDAYEITLRTFGREPNAEMLKSLSEAQLDLLRAECQRYFECDGIVLEKIRIAVARTLARL
ncbi:MAG: hypothetical protein WCJ09_27195 [Planctomycetota bacterium]